MNMAIVVAGWLACSVLSYGWFNGNLEASRPSSCRKRPEVAICAAISALGPVALAISLLFSLISRWTSFSAGIGFWSYGAFSLRAGKGGPGRRNGGKE